MRSPLTRAHPSQPSASLLCRLAPGSGFRPLRRLSHPPAKPPCRFSDQQGSWFEPTWRDGGVEPSTPSWFSSRTDGGRSTTPRAVGRCSRLSTPLAPRISHPQPPERMPSPDILTPNRHHLTFCSACSLVGAGPVSRHLLAPDADADADANGADDVIDDGCDGGDGSEDAATHATTPAFNADAARRCRRRPRPPKPLLPTYPPPRLAAPGHAPPPRPTLRHRFHQCCDAADASPPGCQGSIVRPPLCRGLVCVLCVARRLSSVVGGCLCVPLAATDI